MKNMLKVVASSEPETIEDFCLQIGITGNLQNMLKSAIKTESQLSSFKMFILENNNIRNKLHLVSSFLRNMNIQAFYSKEEFLKGYVYGDRIYALEILSKGHYNNNVLHKVERLLEDGLNLGSLYDTIVNSKELNINNILVLLEKKS